MVCNNSKNSQKQFFADNTLQNVLFVVESLSLFFIYNCNFECFYLIKYVCSLENAQKRISHLWINKWMKWTNENLMYKI